MIPLVKYLGSLHLNNQFGLIIMCVTMSSSQSVFLLTNYIRSVPADLEEAAAIDGCSTFGAYWRVVVPLIKPMTMTIVVLNILWVWNDFQMPLIILNQNSGTWTLPLFQYNFKSQYTYDYNMAFASYLIAMVPVMIAYICAQKYLSLIHICPCSMPRLSMRPVPRSSCQVGNGPCCGDAAAMQAVRIIRVTGRGILPPTRTI